MIERVTARTISDLIPGIKDAGKARSAQAMRSFADFREESWFCEQGKTGNRVYPDGVAPRGCRSIVG
jgi:hypothetical protein